MRPRFRIRRCGMHGWYAVERIRAQITVERFSNRRDAEIFLAGLLWRDGPRQHKPARYGVFHGKRDMRECGNARPIDPA